MIPKKTTKVAIVHYWLTGMRGGEKVLEAMVDCFPEADVFTHVVTPENISPKLLSRIKNTTFINKLPFASKFYQLYLPLMPIALEQLDLSAYDLVISSESGPAKGVITNPSTLHICYCHTPMRYVWDLYHESTKQAALPKRMAMAWLLHRIRLWDYASAARVDHFIANSSFVQQRIRKVYRRDSTVIHPPVAVDNFSISETLDDYYLIVGQLVPYKNVELAVRTFNTNGKPLIIIGEGSEYKKLKSLAKANIKLLGHQPFNVLKQHMSRCQALIFPGIEDFGIVPIEVMASGRPVIALKKGGILDSLIDGQTGIFFHSPTVDSLNAAVTQYEASKTTFDSGLIKEKADKYSRSVFTENLDRFISRQWISQ